MKTLSRYHKLLAVAGAVALAWSATPALAQSFTANEAVIPGALPMTVNADRISFNYAATIQQTGAVGSPGNSFVESGFLTKASFANGGTAVPSQLNASTPNGYGIYGLFNITGSAAPNGAGGINATFSSLTMTLWADPLQNTALGFSGNNAVITGGGTDDLQLASYTLAAGEAHVFGGLAKGDFNTVLNLTLTPFGKTFFVSPPTFYPQEQFGGNTETLVGASLTGSFTASATGAGTELFIAAVPEPETYAMMLAGLGVVGFVARRRKKA